MFPVAPNTASFMLRFLRTKFDPFMVTECDTEVTYGAGL